MYLWSLSMLKFVATSGIECGSSDPFRKFAVLHPLKRSTMRSFRSIADPLLDRGGSSIENGSEDMAARSKKNAFVPFTYIPMDCDPTGRHGVCTVTIY